MNLELWFWNRALISESNFDFSSFGFEIWSWNRSSMLKQIKVSSWNQSSILKLKCYLETFFLCKRTDTNWIPSQLLQVVNLDNGLQQDANWEVFVYEPRVIILRMISFRKFLANLVNIKWYDNSWTLKFSSFFFKFKKSLVIISIWCLYSYFWTNLQFDLEILRYSWL